MKKAILSVLIFCAGVVSAQTTATATVNVKLHPLMSIQVSQPTVLIEVDTESKYINGTSTQVQNHLTTFSTSGFQVSAKAMYPTLSKGTDTIPLDYIMISASGQNNMTYQEVTLSEVATPLISSNLGRGNKTHNVTYKVAEGLWDRPDGEYQVLVQYEITAQ